MSNKKQVLTVQAVLPIVVVVFCFINLGNSATATNPPSAMVSLLGITGVITWFLGRAYAVRLLYAWLLLQVVAVKPYYDATQFFSWGFSFKAGSSVMNVNVLPLLLFGLVKVLAGSALIGKRITLTASGDSALGNVFTLNGAITHRITLDGQKHWLLVQLDDLLVYNGTPVNRVLVCRKDHNILNLRKPIKQLCYLRLVQDSNEVMHNADAAKYPFIEWVYVNRAI